MMTKNNIKERACSLLFPVSGLLVFLIVSGIFLTLTFMAFPSIRHNGFFRFLMSEEWDPVSGSFGVYSFIYGTIVSSVIAIFISIPFSIASAILVTFYIKNEKIGGSIRTMIEIISGIPSVIFGFWGLYIIVPFMTKLQMKMGIIPYGAGIFTASLVLAVMITPYSASIAMESLKSVPEDLSEAGYALGSTRVDVVMRICIPYALSAIYSGVILAFGRALGETMAVTMVIGNSSLFPDSIFSIGNSISSLIANEFAESSQGIHQSALIHAGMVLFLITIAVNGVGRKIIKK